MPLASPAISLQRANLIGGIWMIVAMAGFAVEDSFIKGASTQLPVGQVMVLFGAGGALVFAIVTKIQGAPLWHRDILSPPMRIRVVFEMMGRLFYTLALALTPLSATTAILQATPIVVVLGAAVIFGEKVGWRRWSAIILGLVGVLVILRPTGDAFSALSLLAVLGMLGFAGRDLASRAAPKTISTSILGLYGFLAIVVAGLLFSLWEGRAFVSPDLQTAIFLCGAIAFGTFSYASLMIAMRTGEVSAVTPLRYTRLLFGLGLGIFLFDESLDATMILGCAIVVASGLFILWRGRARQRG